MSDGGVSPVAPVTHAAQSSPMENAIASMTPENYSEADIEQLVQTITDQIMAEVREGFALPPRPVLGERVGVRGLRFQRRLFGSRRPLPQPLPRVRGEEQEKMKVSIIGGGGRVGSNAAFALQCAGIVSEIHLLDANEKIAAWRSARPAARHQPRWRSEDLCRRVRHCADADLICITAGLRRKPDESRLDLINRNVALFKQILDSLHALPA